jgi:hypothetical protein
MLRLPSVVSSAAGSGFVAADFASQQTLLGEELGSIGPQCGPSVDRYPHRMAKESSEPPVTETCAAWAGVIFFGTSLVTSGGTCSAAWLTVVPMDEASGSRVRWHLARPAVDLALGWRRSGADGFSVGSCGRPYSGEVYNFIDLRNELGGVGVPSSGVTVGHIERFGIARFVQLSECLSPSASGTRRRPRPRESSRRSKSSCWRTI